MKIEARIQTLAEKKLIGKHITTSFAENKTFQLWNSFMPRHREIKNSVSADLYSLEVFPVGYFDHFNPENTFEKWAAVEAENFDFIPAEMESLIIPSGLYAVFIHKGPQSEGHKTYNAIFTQWLPNSEYNVDYRPHFAVMNEKYKKEDPDSEEEIWIPIKTKNL